MFIVLLDRFFLFFGWMEPETAKSISLILAKHQFPFINVLQPEFLNEMIWKMHYTNWFLSQNLHSVYSFFCEIIIEIENGIKKWSEKRCSRYVAQSFKGFVERLFFDFVDDLKNFIKWSNWLSEMNARVERGGGYCLMLRGNNCTCTHELHIELGKIFQNIKILIKLNWKRLWEAGMILLNGSNWMPISEPFK